MAAVLVGFDAEWQTGTGENSVLSYQWYGIDGTRHWSGIYYPEQDKPEDKRRLKLHQWVSFALQYQYKGRAWPTRIVMAGHFTPAEMSTIADFGTYKRRFDIILLPFSVTIPANIAL